MPEARLSIERYRAALGNTAAWLARSVDRGRGGSCGFYSPISGWSRPYPETTGYLIPTFLALAAFCENERYAALARKTSRWLLSIQNPDGSWSGGLYPARTPRPSVFNTGQILLGMCAMFRQSQDQQFLDSAARGAYWLSSRVSEEGLWPADDYKPGATPTYYTHVAWPMLEVWSLTNEQVVLDAALRHLDAMLRRRKANGVFEQWGFKPNHALTHTMAYAIRGYQESARLLGDDARYGQAVEKAIDVLARKAELSGGRLPGAFDDEWRPTANYVCLTGNAQLAVCILLLEHGTRDLRLVNAAAKLVDFVASRQLRKAPVPGLNGAVAGSYPLWGGYMILRYPNWAAKYFCDALMLLIARLAEEQVA